MKLLEAAMLQETCKVSLYNIFGVLALKMAPATWHILHMMIYTHDMAPHYTSRKSLETTIFTLKFAFVLALSPKIEFRNRLHLPFKNNGKAHGSI